MNGNGMGEWKRELLCRGMTKLIITKALREIVYTLAYVFGSPLSREREDFSLAPTRPNENRALRNEMVPMLCSVYAYLSVGFCYTFECWLP